MDIQEYAKIVEITEKSKDKIGEVTAETILATLQDTVEQIEEYLNKMIPNFKRIGKIVNKVEANDDEITQEIDILINNRPIEQTEYASLVDEMNKILTENYSYMGWEEQE